MCVYIYLYIISTMYNIYNIYNIVVITTSRKFQFKKYFSKPFLPHIPGFECHCNVIFKREINKGLTHLRAL